MVSKLIIFFNITSPSAPFKSGLCFKPIYQSLPFGSPIPPIISDSIMQQAAISMDSGMKSRPILMDLQLVEMFAPLEILLAIVMIMLHILM